MVKTQIVPIHGESVCALAGRSMGDIALEIGRTFCQAAGSVIPGGLHCSNLGALQNTGYVLFFVAAFSTLFLAWSRPRLK